MLEQKRGRGIGLPMLKLNARRGCLDNAILRTLQPQGIRSSTQSREGLVDTRACLNGSGEEKLSCLTMVGTPTVQDADVAVLTTPSQPELQFTLFKMLLM